MNRMKQMDELRLIYKTRQTASDPAEWKPVETDVSVPIGGVRVNEHGLFRQFMDANIEYLLKSFSVNEMLYPFRVRAGKPNPVRERDLTKEIPFWCVDLLGSEAGRFLMGAGNTLRWMEHAELRRRMDEIVDGVEDCQEENGYVYAFPPEGFLHNEQANYARCWFTQGMLDAAKSANLKALSLIRKGHDWFNECKYRSELIYLSLGLQGHTASTQMYFSPAGKPEDLQVAEKYYVQDWWMDKLIARDLTAIYDYSLDRPHCYEITGFEAYLDHYMATGDRKYIEAMVGAWEMLVENWQHIGGTWAICEGKHYFPKTYPIACTGELCGSVFWIRFNQRFHRLFPDQEKYVAEIEKSIYNAAFANVTSDGIRYHAILETAKQTPNMQNTCCEVHGSRLIGTLPEYIYSIAGDGLYVNLFESSEMDLNIGGTALTVAMETHFPFEPKVTLRVKASSAVKMNLRVRVPGWASSDMPVMVNGKEVAAGKPGTFLALDRIWADGDIVSFTLPISFRLLLYTGIDEIAWNKDRYGLLYGPVLMAAVGPIVDVGHGGSTVDLPVPTERLIESLRPIEGKPLHFNIEGAPDHVYMPYWQVTDETFSALPAIGM